MNELDRIAKLQVNTDQKKRKRKKRKKKKTFEKKKLASSKTGPLDYEDEDVWLPLSQDIRKGCNLIKFIVLILRLGKLFRTLRDQKIQNKIRLRLI